MSEERITESREESQSAGTELREFGRVTQRTRGSWLGLFVDGGAPPFCRELLPLSSPNDVE